MAVIRETEGQRGEEASAIRSTQLRTTLNRQEVSHPTEEEHSFVCARQPFHSVYVMYSTRTEDLPKYSLRKASEAR